MTAKNITRYTYKIASFLGWRLSISKKRKQFTQYFSDSHYGGEEESFQAALEAREQILNALKTEDADPEEIFTSYKQLFAKAKESRATEES